MRLAIGLFVRSRRRQIVLAAPLGVAGVTLLVAGKDVAGTGRRSWSTSARA